MVASALSFAIVTAVVIAVVWPRSNSSAAAHVPTENNSSPLNAREQDLLYQAEQIAFGNCLRERGFRYWPEPQPAPSVFQIFPYVINDVAWAKANGFGGNQARADARLAAADPDTRYSTGLSRSRRQALGVAENGDGPGGSGVTVTLPTGLLVGHSSAGCTVTAEDRLYGSFAAWFRAENVAESLPALWQSDVVSDPRFGAAVSRWSRCMRGRHYRYASPAAAADVFTNPAHLMPRSTEVRVATAEAQCAMSTGLSTLARALNAHYQHVVELRYRTVIITFRRLARAALPRARALLQCNYLHCPPSFHLRNHPQGKEQ
jgi:hypothetical protein